MLTPQIRRAKASEARRDKELSVCGSWARKELQRLCKWEKDPPYEDQWRMFYARFCNLIALYRGSKSEGGMFVRRLEREMDALWLFLLPCRCDDDYFKKQEPDLTWIRQAAN